MSERQYSPQRFSILPPVVKNLLIINVLVYLATIVCNMAFHIDLNDYIGLRYPGASDFRFYQFFTYMFAHGSFSHLFFNMFALWMFGSVIENAFGEKRFIIYYLVCGFGAALTHYAVAFFEINPIVHSINYIIDNPTAENIFAFVKNHKFNISQYSDIEIRNGLASFNASLNTLQYNNHDSAAIQTCINFLTEYKEYFKNIPNVVGASGAIYGLLLAFGMLFPNSLIYLYFFIPIKAKWFVIIFGVIELVSGITSTGNIAHFAHLGGMIFGVFLIIYWRKKGVLRI
ncbi:MAG: rhomboid family intramembrane serine protease [Bacteroidales bacterium]|jgi:membrane associated rhomboid family serine protease|nr:rhomboid family intramembrane serine protease [Bacteroidales bacterium]